MAMPRRIQGIALGVTCLVAVGGAVVIGVRTLPHATVGSVDPLAAVVALAALVGGLWAGYLSLRALRWQETSVADAAQRLALAVRDAERNARRQLLGGHDRTIDVDFEFRPAPSHNAQFAAPVGHLDQVVGYYRDLRPGRMVVTGAPAGQVVRLIVGGGGGGDQSDVLGDRGERGEQHGGFERAGRAAAQVVPQHRAVGEEQRVELAAFGDAGQVLVVADVDVRERVGLG